MPWPGCNYFVLLAVALFTRLETLNIKPWPFQRLNGAKLEQHQCDSQVFCKGPLLHAVQMAGIFVDSKRFVDMPAKYNEATILKKFDRLGKKPSKEQLTEFVAENFHRPGWDLQAIIPTDWKDKPKFLDKIKDKKLAQFGSLIHAKWKALVRVVDAGKTCGDCVTTSIPLPHPFVVPGGRFRELYYWDSFWILEGLFVSEMCGTAQSILDNFKWLIEKYGFIPNGSRKYYLNRSHPPLFIQMCQRFAKECVPDEEQRDWIRKMLPFMDQEYIFWTTFRTVSLPQKAQRAAISGDALILTMYQANTVLPRPESYWQDKVLASQLTFSPNETVRTESLYRSLATGAESGWDFTVRWFRDPHSNLTSIAAADVIPIDLNVIMYRNEKILEKLHSNYGSTIKSAYYGTRAKLRNKGIKDYLDEWSDYDLAQNKSMSAKHLLMSSDLAGLWFGGLDHDNVTDIEEMIAKHQKLLFGYPGGIPNNEIVSGEQWDFPNVWAPIQYHFITIFEELAKLDSKWEFKAQELAQKFVNTSFCGYQNYGKAIE